MKITNTPRIGYRNVRAFGHFELIFGRLEVQDRIITAVRKSLDTGSLPFLMCKDCGAFRIKLYNGNYWFADTPDRAEFKLAVALIKKRIPELPEKPDHLADLDYCPVCPNDGYELADPLGYLEKKYIK